MRRFRSIVKITALEVLSEPLTLLVSLVALALAVLAPVFHYHQFGEPTRMARDAGLSAILTGGCVLAIFGAIRAFRREIESGTFEMALSHSISRGFYFLAKTVGVALALIFVALVVFGVLVTIVIGAAVGGQLAEETGSLARVWGPSVVAGVAVLVLPLALGALFNRFGRFRFILTAMVCFGFFSLVSTVVFIFWIGSCELTQLLVAFFQLVVFLLIVLSISAAFAIRFAANAAASLSGLSVLALLPFVGNYYLAGNTFFAVCAAVPAIVAFLILGVKWTNERI